MHLHSEFEEAQIFCCACFYDHYLILINKSYQSFENNNVCFHDKVMEKRNPRNKASWICRGCRILYHACIACIHYIMSINVF